MKRFLTGLLSLVIGVLASPAGAADGLIAADEAFAAAQRGKLLIIDVRTPAEWRESGIPQGAKTAEFGAPDFIARVMDAVGPDKARPVAVICRSGNRSTRAKDALAAAGFTNVLNIKEGMSGGGAGAGWLKRGLPTSPP